jgi:SNF2 family DNA or RNA helicase
VVVTTYDIFTIDAAVFKRVEWEVAALDEAHKLKNDEAKLFLKLKECKLNHRVCLTGTPLQNNVRELFNCKYTQQICRGCYLTGKYFHSDELY